MKILIKNVDIITGENKEVIKNGYICIENTDIVMVTSNIDDTNSFKADKVIDGKKGIVMPGLVNAHTHSPMAFLRNFADDLPLEDWLFGKIIPTEGKLSNKDIYFGAMLGIAEMIKSGTTCFADMYFHMDEVGEAVLESGIRANLSKGPITSSVRGNGLIVDTEECTRYINKWNNSGNGRIKTAVEIHSVYLFDEESITGAAKLAKDLDVGIHIHISETKNELKVSQDVYGANPVEVCLRAGIFDVPVIAAHCVHLSDNDIEILREKSVSAVHNPSSNLKLGSGIARVQAMLDAGINVCLGTDGVASNNNLNMFEEMHLTALIHKGHNMNPLMLSASDVIKMATVNGAKALGFNNQIGLIKEGMKADLILINTDSVHMCPVNNPISAVVYSAQASDVETVIIDGNIVMENRKLLTIDEDLIKSKVLEITERIK